MVRRAELREVVASSFCEEVSLGFRRMDRRISLDADSFLSTSIILLMGWGGRGGSCGPCDILTNEKATSNGHGCADYELPLREGGTGGRYQLEMAWERFGTMQGCRKG